MPSQSSSQKRKGIYNSAPLRARPAVEHSTAMLPPKPKTRLQADGADPSAATFPPTRRVKAPNPEIFRDQGDNTIHSQCW